ncbi:MAG: hypothetical protein ACLFVP_07470 [Candidatus Bathyarchaeia archaeon]
MNERGTTQHALSLLEERLGIKMRAIVRRVPGGKMEIILSRLTQVFSILFQGRLNPPRGKGYRETSTPTTSTYYQRREEG